MSKHGVYNRIVKFFAQWPVIVIVVGVLLTLMWVAALVWFSLSAIGYAVSLSSMVT
jgi:hypothetical protein